MEEFVIFGTTINNDLLVFMGLFFFFGLLLGWFCRKGSLFWIFVGLMICSPIVGLVMDLNLWFVTTPFILGFLIHTGKPLLRKVTQE